MNVSWLELSKRLQVKEPLDGFDFENCEFDFRFTESPFDRLPNELIAEILLLLGGRDRMECCRLSRRFYEIYSSNPNLIVTLRHSLFFGQKGIRMHREEQLGRKPVSRRIFYLKNKDLGKYRHLFHRNKPKLDLVHLQVIADVDVNNWLRVCKPSRILVGLIDHDSEHYIEIPAKCLKIEMKGFTRKQNYTFDLTNACQLRSIEWLDFVPYTKQQIRRPATLFNATKVVEVIKEFFDMSRTSWIREVLNEEENSKLSAKIKALGFQVTQTQTGYQIWFKNFYFWIWTDTPVEEDGSDPFDV